MARSYYGRARVAARPVNYAQIESARTKNAGGYYDRDHVLNLAIERLIERDARALGIQSHTTLTTSKAA